MGSAKGDIENASHRAASAGPDPASAAVRLESASPRIDWKAAQVRYGAGESRSFIFRDLVRDEIRARAGRGAVTVLDIGCGKGFDSQPELQREVASMADVYVGVEPDPQIEIQPVFAQCLRGTIEDLAIPPESIDVAFSVMVLEHVGDPERHWRAIHSALKPGGVFWGFTMDSRHWFTAASRLAGALRIKDLYLNLLHGARGEDRYENYPTYYRTNRPDQVRRWTGTFRSVESYSFYQHGQSDYYFPPALRWIGQNLDTAARSWGGIGLVFAVRAVK